MEQQNSESQTPPADPTPSIKNSSSLKSKWPLLVILLLVLVLLPLGGYFLINEGSKNKPSPTVSPTPTQTVSLTASPTPTQADETADWKTYTNTASGYSVKYPDDLYVRLICPDEELTLRTRQASDTKDEETFETCGRGGRFTIEVVTAASLTEPSTDEFVEVTKEDIAIAGVPARKYISTRKPTAEGPIPDWSEDIYFEKGGKKHLIHFDKGVSDDIKTKFLSTFKFI